MIYLILILTAMTQSPGCPDISVTGGIIFTGNEPFTVPVLYVDEDKRYFLNVSDEVRKEMGLHAGKTVKITGRLYEDDWLGKKTEFIKVTSYEWIENDL